MKKCLIIVNTYKKVSTQLGEEIKEYLKRLDVESDIFLFNGFCEEYPFPGYDFVITLGGDGTVLFAARGCAGLGIPIFPVNLGTFGFIASVQTNEWQEGLLSFLAGRMPVEERSMIHAELIRNGSKRFASDGLNEVVISAKHAAHIVCIDVAFNSIPLGEFKADGIIVSTATGSTAYNVAAGGPIIDPSLDAFVLTLMNPFSLSSRPLVLNADGELEITIKPSRVSEVVVSVDGQIPIALHVNDCVRLRRTGDKALLVGCNPEKFFGALRSKLNWSGGPGA